MGVYEKIIESIESAPVTYLGGILICVVRECVKKKFFKSGHAMKNFIAGHIDTEKRRMGR